MSSIDSDDGLERESAVGPLAKDAKQDAGKTEPKTREGTSNPGRVTLNKMSALSQALERDKAWLEHRDEPAERLAIDAELLADKPEDNVAPSLSRDAFASTITKTTKDFPMPKQPVLLKLFGLIAKHPLPFGAALIVTIATAALVPLQSLRVASQEVKRGNDLLASGDTKSAIAAFDQALRANPSNSEALLYRARAYSRAGDPQSALLDYKQFLKIEPRNLQALSECANTSSFCGQYKPAIAYFQQYLAVVGDDGPKSIDAATGLARAYIADGHPAPALEQLNKLHDLKPNDVDILLLRASCSQSMGMTGAAIIDCTQAIKINPKSDQAFVLRGSNYQQQHKAELARADFDHAVSMSPKDPSLLVRRGAYFASLKEFDRAMQDFAAAITLNPLDFDAYQQRAKTYFLKGDKAKAEQEYDALAALPGFKPNASYFAGRAEFYIRAENFEKAMAELKKALALDGVHKYGYLLKMADCYGGLKQYAQAVDLCDKVLLAEPTNADAICKHGQYSYLAGNKMTATADLSKAVQIAPNNANAHLQMANVYFAEKQFCSAMDDYQRALDLDPSLSSAVAKLAFCKAQIGQLKPSPAHHQDDSEPADSISKAERTEISQADAKTLQTKGYKALEAGKANYALAALTRAVQLQPNEPLSRRYLAYAMVTAGDGAAAVEQFYAWDKLEGSDPQSEAAFAKALADSGDSANAKVVFDYITAKNSTDAKVLLSVARTCAALSYVGQATSAITAGLKVATDGEKEQFNQVNDSLTKPTVPASCSTPAAAAAK